MARLLYAALLLAALAGCGPKAVANGGESEALHSFLTAE